MKEYKGNRVKKHTDSYIVIEKPRSKPRYAGEMYSKRLYRDTCHLCNTDKGYVPKQCCGRMCQPCNGRINCSKSLEINHWKILGNYSPPKEELTPEVIEKRRKIISTSAAKTYQRYKRQIHERRKLNSTPNQKIASKLRNGFQRAIQKGCENASAVRDLGCSIEEFKFYIESKFQPGMTWDNWSRTGWHMDHILPLDSFDLSDLEQQLKACHYSNLQPLWAKENLKKGKRLLLR